MIETMPNLKSPKLILFLLLCISGSSYGRTNLDSLYAVWQDETKADSSRVDAYEDYILKGVLYSDPDSAIVLAQVLLTFGEQHQYVLANAKAYHLMGTSYYVKFDYAQSLDYFQRSLKVREEIGDKRRIALVMGNIGLIYSYLENYPKALDYNMRSLKIWEENGDKKYIVNATLKVGNIYHWQGNYPKALDYLQRSLKISIEIGDSMIMAQTLGNIGNIYSDQGDYPKAMEYCQRGLKID